MNHTTNYQLNQWETDDQVSRLDFNADNAKIDAALAAKAAAAEIPRLDQAIETKVGIVTGFYKGNDTDSRFIELGFTPKAVLLFKEDGSTTDNSSHYGGLVLPDRPAQYFSDLIASITEGGFEVYNKVLRNDRIFANNSTYTYHYIAFK